ERCGIMRLPTASEGGVVLLGYLVARKKLSIIWPFLSPSTPHWVNQQNLALFRLADHWRAKKLMNKGSVEEWFEKEAREDVRRNLQVWPVPLELKTIDAAIRFTERADKVFTMPGIESLTVPREIKRRTLALIAHDDMKNRMAEFASDYEA